MISLRNKLCNDAQSKRMLNCVPQIRCRSISGRRRTCRGATSTSSGCPPEELEAPRRPRAAGRPRRRRGARPARSPSASSGGRDGGRWPTDQTEEAGLSLSGFLALSASGNNLK